MDKIFLNTGFSLLFGVFTIFALSFLGFIFDFSISLIYPLSGLFVTFLVFALRLYKDGIKPEKIVKYSILLGITLIVLTYLSGLLMDPSCDGRRYHQITAILLEKGWNPIYDNVYSFSNTHFNDESYGLIWSENYVKFSEIIAANILHLTGKIETGKVFNGISGLIAFCYAFYVLSKPVFSKLDTKMRLIFSFLLVYNPVFLAQFFTYYVDGLLYLYFLIAILALTDWKTELETSQKPTVAMCVFIMASVIMLNIKLGGFLCFISILFCAPFFLKAKRFWHSVFVVIILTLLSGINPYFTNISKDRHPLYPIFGENKIDIITPNTPRAFADKPVAYKFFTSLFSKMDNFAYDSDEKPKLKIPFSVSKSELPVLDDTDTRISGFGIFFSGIFLMMLAFFFLPNYKTLCAKNEFCIIFTTLGLATLLNPESWWARYIPQLWAFAVFAGIFAYLNPPVGNSLKARYFKYFIRLFLLILFINSFLINTASAAWARKYTVRTNRFINEIKTLQTKDNTAIIRKIPEHPGVEFSYLRKLEEAGVNYDIQK